MIDYSKLRLPVAKSKEQKTLEANGCRFISFGGGQARLDIHELDPGKPCCCGRPGKAKK